MIGKLVDPAQSGFIKGRFIGDNTRLMSDIIAYLKEESRSGVFLSLDIEGAFNTVSWKFINAALVRYKIPLEMIKWFNLMNEGSFARILYNGHLSDKIKLSRSCRQGDPVSPYIFLLAIECLAVQVRQNQNIKGITIHGIEIKVSCYADDTLFLLDGSVNSCRRLFHDLGTFAKFSGLRPNIAKTQAMWVGHGVEERTGLCEELPIQWTNRMKVLGISFENDLDNMSKNNFEGKIDEIKSVIKTWYRRHLTIYGKICVIKSLILPKLTHLLSSLPNPTPEFIRGLDTILYQFVWNGKRDKISRKSMAKQVQYGGAGMVDTHSYMQALKVSWVKRQLQSDNQWAKLFECKIGFGDCIWDRNARSLKNFSRRIQFNRFWSDVALAVAEFKAAYGDYSWDEMSSCSLWYSDYSKFYNNRIHSWFSRGIRFLNDMLKADGAIMSFEEAKHIYGIAGLQFDYDCVVSSLPRIWRTANKTKLYGPLIDPSLAFILSKSHGAKHIYGKLVSLKIKGHVHKWERKWNEAFRDIAWNEVYGNISRINSMRYRSTQYKIVTRTHATQSLLHQIGVANSNTCNRCREYEDNIEHKFWHCRFVQIFWNSIADWLTANQILENRTNLSAKSVLLGLGAASTFIGHVILVAKMIIQRREHLRLTEVIRWLQSDRELEEVVARVRGDRRPFVEKWEPATEALS